jgi:hypothetical protein
MKLALFSFAFLACGFVVGCGSDGGATSSVVEDDVGSFAEGGVDEETGADATTDATGDSMTATDTGAAADTGTPSDTGSAADSKADSAGDTAPASCAACTSGQSCCVKGGASSCIAKGGTCAGGNLYACLAKPDCPGLQVCCATKTGGSIVGSSCAGVCVNETFCTKDSDCTALGKTKCSGAGPSGLKTCGS